jgi:uracil-DNA glycosylase family 4
MTKPALPAEPESDCQLCPRLAGFRAQQRAEHPEWFNAPVPCFGNKNAQLLIVGLAPGLRGANRTGRPFTGDYAGDLLYATLAKFGFSSGSYDMRPDDGLRLNNACIANAVRCVPPQNKPTPLEIRTCNGFLQGVFAQMPNLKVIICLGRVSHEASLKALGAKLSSHSFGHGTKHSLGQITVFDSYHCSRYNTNTGRLNAEMFESVFAQAKQYLEG